VIPALRAAPGIYNVTDRCPRTQGELSEAVAAGIGRPLHPLFDVRWGHGPIFGRSRRLDGAVFAAATGWSPRVPDSADRLAELCRARVGR
jgi:nucleoside-diphosphate-sugar epimerase